MKYNNWNLTKLINTKKLLQDDFMQTNNESILDDLYLIEQIINDSISLFPIPISFYEKIQNDIIVMEQYDYFLESINKLINAKTYIPSLEDYKLERYQTLNCSFILGFTHDFYNSLDHDIASLFNHEFKNRKDNIRFTNKRSSSIYLPYSKQSYINIARNKTVEDFINCIHEYGHVIADQIRFRENYYNYPFVELASMFFSLLAYDRLIYDFEDMDKDVVKLRVVEAKTNEKNALMINLFNIYYNENDLILSRKKTTKDMKRKLNKKILFIKELLEMSNIERYSYVLPYMVAIELYMTYLEDPEKAFYLLKEIIKMDEQDNYLIKLEDMNIHISQSTTEFFKTLKKK